MNSLQSIDELNKLIPRLETIMNRIMSLNDKSNAIAKDVDNLFEIWGEQLVDPSNPDAELFLEKKRAHESVKSQRHEEVSKIEELGGIMKDLNKGLIDFPMEWNGESVFLCWKLGESEIAHWHPMRGGFGARRSIKELPQSRSV